MTNITTWYKNDLMMFPIGFVPRDFDLLNVDLLSLAGNPFYGPLGTGALFVRKGIRISPLISGGIQEKGLRAGTTGSTCSSQALKVSHVLKALRIDPLWAQGSLAFTLGIENTADDIEYFLSNFPSIVESLRQMSPLVAKYQRKPQS